MGLVELYFLYFALKMMGTSFTTVGTYQRLARMVPKLSMKPIHSLTRYFTYFTYLMKFVLCMRKYSKPKWAGLGWVGLVWVGLKKVMGWVGLGCRKWTNVHV